MKQLLFCIALLLLLGSCVNKYETALEHALNTAGNNRSELEKVLKYYERDSLKLEAAKFLIINMENHGEDLYLLYDKLGNPASINILDFRNENHLLMVMDSLYRTREVINKKSKKPDLEYISSNYLIKQIELAFKVWEKPWSKGVGFQDFCRYILPYRSQDEALSNMREVFLDRYMEALDTIQGLNCPVEACRIINTLLKDSIRYENMMNKVDYSRSIDDIYKSGYGRCDEICDVGLYIMRAVGIPVAKDFTLWARMRNGHEWCSVLDLEGNWHAFGVGEDQPDELIEKLRNKSATTLSKVYRYTYEIQKNPKLLQFNEDNKYPIPTIFNSFLVQDVSSFYFPKNTLVLTIDPKYKYSYLCVFNNMTWQAVDFAKTKNAQAHFNDIGTDFINNKNNVVYTHCIYKFGRMIPYSPPFELLADGSKCYFIESKTDYVQALLPTIDPKLESNYYYWNSDVCDWVKLIPKKINQSGGVYDSIPENALLFNEITYHDKSRLGRCLGIVKDGEFERH